MKILVTAKRVIDHNVRVRVRPDGSGVETENVKMALNPFDRHAVEAAIQLQEQGAADETVVVTLGPSKANDVLLAALAMGIDRAIHLETDEALQPLAVANALADLIRAEAPDLVLMGKQAVDDDNAATAQILAGLLDWPMATCASDIAVDSGRVRVTREMDFGQQTDEMALPAVISADLRLNVPRNTTLPNVIKAKKKPIDKKALAGDGSGNLSVEKTVPPPERGEGERLADGTALAAKVRELAGGAV